MEQKILRSKRPLSDAETVRIGAGVHTPDIRKNPFRHQVYRHLYTVHVQMDMEESPVSPQRRRHNVIGGDPARVLQELES